MNWKEPIVIADRGACQRVKSMHAWDRIIETHRNTSSHRLGSRMGDRSMTEAGGETYCYSG
jgi:hypothetical protein